MSALNEKKVEILKKYSELAKKLGTHPTIEQLNSEKNITRDMVKHHFSSKENMKSLAKSNFPENFDGIIDEELYNPTHFKEMVSTLSSKYSRFFITNAVSGGKADKNCIKSAKTFARKNKAAILVVVSNNDLSEIDKTIVDDPELHVIYDDMALNKNLHISTVKIDPKGVDPLQGMERIAQRDGSVIFSSPKQRLKAVANKRSDLPFVMMTTGSITRSEYRSKAYAKTRRDIMAQYDHVMGGLIVEIEDSEIFHYRQIQFEKSGNFVDLGTYYQGNNVSTLLPEALIMGDYHSIDKDPIADAALRSLAKQLQVKTLVMHDVFDGKSISHHDQHRKIYRSMLFQKGKLSLENELEVLAQDLNDWSKLVKEIVVVESNHDDFLARYLEDGRWINEAHNYKMASLLNAEMVKGNRPLIEGAKMKGLKAENIKWLEKDDSFKIARVELGDHGDKGSNGAKGSLPSMERAYGNSISGHSHSPEILRGAWQVGTTSKLKLDYNRGGSSSWFHTSCLLYKNGARQLINVVNGKCSLDPIKPNKK